MCRYSDCCGVRVKFTNGLDSHQNGSDLVSPSGYASLLRAQTARRKAEATGLESLIKQTLFAPLPGSTRTQPPLRNEANSQPPRKQPAPSEGVVNRLAGIIGMDRSHPR